MDDKKKLIARIHIAKNKAQRCPEHGLFFALDGKCPQCGNTGESLPDFYYRQILLSAGGKKSSTELSEENLKKVLEVFDKAGFKEAYPYISPAKAEKEAREALQKQIYFRAKQVLGPNWQFRLQGFLVRTVGTNYLSFCSMKQLRQVIGWINRAEKYSSKEQNNEKGN